MKFKIKSFWPAIDALIVATYLFCLPGDEFPEESWLDKIHFDKWVHIGLFFVLVFLWTLPFLVRTNDKQIKHKIYLRVTLVFIAYGILIEFVQWNFVPFRSFDVFDIVADAVGCVLGWIAAKKISG